jgi:hypothetical protein
MGLGESLALSATVAIGVTVVAPVAVAAPIVSVFVSSTWSDLQPERTAIERALNFLRETKLNGMEYFGSQAEDACGASLDRVRSSLTRVSKGLPNASSVYRSCRCGGGSRPRPSASAGGGACKLARLGHRRRSCPHDDRVVVMKRGEFRGV